MGVDVTAGHIIYADSNPSASARRADKEATACVLSLAAAVSELTKAANDGVWRASLARAPGQGEAAERGRAMMSAPWRVCPRACCRALVETSELAPACLALNARTQVAKPFTVATNVKLLSRKQWASCCTLPEGCTLEWPAQALPGVLQQPNAVDCGVFAMAFLHAMASHVSGTPDAVGESLQSLQMPRLPSDDLGCMRLRTELAYRLLIGGTCDLPLPDLRNVGR